MNNMKDMFLVDVTVDEVEYREATGLVRFDEDPSGHFYSTIDSNVGALRDRITAAVRGVLAQANPQVNWQVSTQPWQTPMTARGRYDRAKSGASTSDRRPGRKPRGN